MFLTSLLVGQANGAMTNANEVGSRSIFHNSHSHFTIHPTDLVTQQSNSQLTMHPTNLVTQPTYGMLCKRMKPTEYHVDNLPPSETYTTPSAKCFADV